MTRSTPTTQRMHRRPSWLLVLGSLLIANLVGGCDGGLFGTGDGDNLTVETGPSDSSEQPASVEPGDEAPINGVIPDAAPESPPFTLIFSNTESAGVSSSIADLPALKVINLLDESVTASLAGGDSITAVAQSVSSLLGVNVGASRVSFSTSESVKQLAVIDPLNAAANSITTVLISSQIGATNTQQANLFALSTQASVSAPGMAQVRVVLATVPEAPDTKTSFTLQSDDSLSAGADVVFSEFFDNNTPLDNYSLANAGRYQLIPTNGSFPAQAIELLPDQVYTLIVTGNDQMPVFIEVDSRVE